MEIDMNNAMFEVLGDPEALKYLGQRALIAVAQKAVTEVKTWDDDENTIPFDPSTGVAGQQVIVTVTNGWHIVYRYAEWSGEELVWNRGPSRGRLHPNVLQDVHPWEG